MRQFCFLLTALSLLLPAGRSQAVGVVFSATGADKNDPALVAAVTSFRNALGNPNNGVGVAANPLVGRREINWDAAGLDAFQSPNAMPATFFITNSARGAFIQSPGGTTRVSQRLDNGGGNLRFGDINPTYNTTFQDFSAARLFAPFDNTTTEATFFVPGTGQTRPATVKGFGVIFTDVDEQDSTSITLYDRQNQVLAGPLFAEIRSGGLSLLGVKFDAAEEVARVVVTSGDTPLSLGVNDGSLVGANIADVVAQDDWFYSEPVPEPSTMVLTGLVLAAAVIHRRRNR